MAPRASLISAPSATEQFLARLGCDRDAFLRGHFAAAWGWYERLTALCTAGRINAWREECVAACGLRPGDRMLDVATGTGPVLFRAIRVLGVSGVAVGLDVSLDGLIDGRAEATKQQARAQWVQGRALPLPFRDGSFDAVIVGFALRHLGAPQEVLRELRRVLAPGGRLGIVDFLRPWPGLTSWAGLAYLFWVVPLISLLLSRRRAVYRLARYLPHSILDASRPEQLAHAMGASGFALETARPICAGIVWLFAGRATAPAEDMTAVRTTAGVSSTAVVTAS